MCCEVQVWHMREFNQGLWLCQWLWVRWQQWWTELWRLYIWTRWKASDLRLISIPFLPMDVVKKHMIFMHSKKKAKFLSVCLYHIVLNKFTVNCNKLGNMSDWIRETFTVRTYCKNALTSSKCYMLLPFKDYVDGMTPAKVRMTGIEIAEVRHPETRGQMWITH